MRCLAVLLCAALFPESAGALLLSAPHQSAAAATAAVSRSAAVRCQGAAPQIAKPKTKQVTKTRGPGSGDGGSGGAGAAQVAKPKRKTYNEDMPMYKVILLSDEEYEQDPVCTTLRTVIPAIENERQALERYNEAMSTGRSLLITVPEEHAYHYREQLMRCDPSMIVYSTVEEE